MSMDWNDPRLTAYALGELEGAELKEMEALVNKSEEARQAVQEIRETAKMLSEELKSEPIPQLKLAAPKAQRSSWLKPMLNPYLGLVAAGLAAVLLAMPQWKAMWIDEKTPAAPAPVMDVVSEPPPVPAPEEPVLFAETETKKDAPKAGRVSGLADQHEAQESEMLADVEPGPAKRAEMPKPALVGSAAVKGGSELSKKMAVARRERHAFGGTGAAGFAPTSEMERDQNFNTESYSHIQESDFVSVKDHPLSTFSTDVDTASYAIVRRFITSGSLPPADAVRIEELINYFPYNYPAPKDDKPFAVHVEQAHTPWHGTHKLVRIGLKGREIDLRKRPKSNLVFLIDVSGSMADENKLPLLKSAMKQLIDQLNDNDRVAMVVYAGASGLVLPPTSDKTKMVAALEKLDAGGSTNGGEGIELAYRVAQENFISGGTNRVILATDGDFNVGTTSEGELVRLIETKARSKVFLTVLGFGSGNYKDSNMEKLADKGNGNYAYIDSLQEAKKALVKQIGGTLVTIAKDVKIQVEFNPKFVGAYRLIGYENRKLNKEDFNDDTKDAGEIGAGHTVTALYELIAAGEPVPGSVDTLKYQKVTRTAEAPANDSSELLTVKLRYKQPEGDTSQLIEVPVENQNNKISRASDDMKFAASVAQFGMILRDSKWKGDSSWQSVLKLGREGQRRGDEYRREFLELVEKARKLKK